jgi:FKBP-type peptidyl-prolyl cis-trans isomerase FkpA
MTQFRPKNSFKQSISSSLTLLFVIVGLFSMTACSKSDSNNDTNTTTCTLKAQYANDSDVAQRALMVAFCKNNNINYTIHPSGILYEITAAGDTAKPNLCTSITMTYKGKLMTGIQFDAGTITYPLKDLIVGWQIMVPLIGKGGKIKMVIPSSLAYGPNAVGTIPANSPLYFEMSID